MTRTFGKLLVVSICTLVFLTGFQVSSVFAATQTGQTTNSKGEVNQSELQWLSGKISKAPYKVGKTETAVSIDAIQYILASQTVIIEQIEEKPGSVVNVPSSQAVLAYGKYVSFAFSGENQPVIHKIVVDSVPHKK